MAECTIWQGGVGRVGQIQYLQSRGVLSDILNGLVGKIAVGYFDIAGFVWYAVAVLSGLVGIGAMP